MQKKITYIISGVHKALAFEWIAEHLHNEKFTLNFILLNRIDSDLEDFLRQKKIGVTRVSYSGKKDIPKAIYRVARILNKTRPHIVHTHIFDANLVGLIAAHITGIAKRIHTRHHSGYHHDYHPRMVKYDKLVNFLSTDIVAISKTVETILIQWEHVNPQKIHLIHHGFDLKSFENVESDSVAKLSATYNPRNQYPVIGVISRYTEWKGIQFIIPAFSELLKTYPGALLILANADGDYKTEIQLLLKNISPENFIEIPFENNIFALYKLFDIFVHTPINGHSEAFGQTYVEALASGIPSVFTLSGIANEFIINRKNALVVPYKDTDAILAAMKELLSNTETTKEMVAFGKHTVMEKFRLDKMMSELEQLYLS
jgi:glycosyltransferase involved in cell wall biosynthesis